MVVMELFNFNYRKKLTLGYRGILQLYQHALLSPGWGGGGGGAVTCSLMCMFPSYVDSQRFVYKLSILIYSNNDCVMIPYVRFVPHIEC